MWIIITFVLGIIVGHVITIIVAWEPKSKECNNCKQNWNSCGGSAFGPCERWEKK